MLSKWTYMHKSMQLYSILVAYKCVVQSINCKKKSKFVNCLALSIWIHNASGLVSNLVKEENLKLLFRHLTKTYFTSTVVTCRLWCITDILGILSMCKNNYIFQFSTVEDIQPFLNSSIVVLQLTDQTSIAVIGWIQTPGMFHYSCDKLAETKK